MNGVVGLRDLRIDCVVGIYDFERVGDQPLFVDVELITDFGPAARSEDVADTIDYDHVAALLASLARDRRYQLIETFAAESVDAILARWPAVSAVQLEIRKPQAVPAAACSFVRLQRAR